MNKKVIYIGVGVVVAYLLYKKFVVKSDEKTTAETDADTTETEEQAEGEGGGAPSGGGGGGGSAPAPKPTDKPMAKKSMLQPKPKMGLRPNERTLRPRRRGRVIGTSTPMSLKMARPLPATKPMQKLAGFMDFDGFPDVQAEIM